MAAILATLQAFTVSAITPPVPLASTATRVAPTAAARALSVAALDRLPPAPVTVALQCLASEEGQLTDCIAADGGGTSNLAVYRQRLFALPARAKADPILAAALARIPFYRVQPTRASGKATVSVLVREVVSAADQAPRGAPRGTVAKGGLGVDPEPAMTIGAFYPPAALRAGAQTRVTANCRVLGDRSLFCREPQVDLLSTSGDPPLWRVPALDPSFAQATVRVFATMRAQSRTVSGEDSAGCEVPLTIVWQLP